MAIQNTIRNILLSAIHNLLRYEYKIQLLSLMGIEILYLCIMVGFQMKWKYYK